MRAFVRVIVFTSLLINKAQNLHFSKEEKCLAIYICAYNVPTGGRFTHTALNKRPETVSPYSKDSLNLTLFESAIETCLSVFCKNWFISFCDNDVYGTIWSICLSKCRVPFFFCLIQKHFEKAVEHRKTCNYFTPFINMYRFQMEVYTAKP